MENPVIENGIYRSENATYYVKDGKVMMALKGSYYKTTQNFMVGAKLVEPLKPEMVKDFDQAYEKCSTW